MSDSVPTHHRRARAWIALALSAASTLLVGCQSSPAPAEHATNPALRRLAVPLDATRADADRAALARFVGVWTFEGWSTGPGTARNAAKGRAAGTIENEHFILLDFQTTVAAPGGGGRAGRKSGSMLFASEPAIGATLSAWGDASPAITRLVGRIEGHGSAFVYDEVKTPAGMPRHSITIIFKTDDQWTAEIRDASASGAPLIASYQFTRAG